MEQRVPVALSGNPVGGDRGLPSCPCPFGPRRDGPRGGVHPISARNEGAFRASRVPTRGSAYNASGPGTSVERQANRRSSAHRRLEELSRARRTLKRSCIRLAPASMREVHSRTPQSGGFDVHQANRHYCQIRYGPFAREATVGLGRPFNSTSRSLPRCLTRSTRMGEVEASQSTACAPAATSEAATAWTL